MTSQRSGNPLRSPRHGRPGARMMRLLTQCLVLPFTQSLALALALSLALGSASAQAALKASLDRYRIAMGDTVRLTLRSDEAEDPGDADTQALEQHFEVLQRSSSVNTSIINGKRNQVRELVLELTPRREGSIVIPPFVVGQKRSEALSVDVAPKAETLAEDEIVTFEAILDRESVYVQGQLLLTLRVQQAVNLDSRSITELALDNAYVEALGQNSFQRTVDGRPWLVHEIRYAIFPEASGELRIPVQVFSGRVGTGRRSLFDTRPSGRLIRRETQELRIEVMARPASYPDATWLPSSALTIEEQWSAPLDKLRTGDSVTRTITVTGDGLQGAQLPPSASAEIDGLRAYPDQPDINNISSERGITGIRVDSVALVAVGDGEYLLPRVEVPWWDTDTDSLQFATLPERRITVVAPASSRNPADSSSIDAVSPASGAATPAPAEASWWRYIAAFCALGWLLTAYLWWHRGGRAAAAAVPNARSTASPASAQDVLAACRAGDASGARDALNRWLRDPSGPGGLTGSLADWARKNGNPEFADAVADLERHLYDSDKNGAWDGQALAKAVRQQKILRFQGTQEPESALSPLYLSQ